MCVCCRGAPRGAVRPCDRHLPALASVSPASQGGGQAWAGLHRLAGVPPAEVRPGPVCTLPAFLPLVMSPSPCVSSSPQSLKFLLIFFLTKLQGAFPLMLCSCHKHLRSRRGGSGTILHFGAGVVSRGRVTGGLWQPCREHCLPPVSSLSVSISCLSQFLPPLSSPSPALCLGGTLRSLSAQDLASQQSFPLARSLLVPSPVSAESLQEPGRFLSAWYGLAALLRVHTVSLMLTCPSSWVPHQLTPLGANLTGPHCLVASGC